MSYTPNNWQTGDIVTTQKLNNIEQGIKGNETIFLDVVWQNYINEHNAVTFSMDAEDVITAVQAGKDVKARLGHISGGVTTFDWIAPIAYYFGGTNINTSHVICAFAVSHRWGEQIAPCAIEIVDNGEASPRYHMYANFHIVYENTFADLTWSGGSEYEHQVAMFDSDNWGGIQYRTVENLVYFGTTGEELIQAALAGAETQKTTLSVVYGDGEEAAILYNVLASPFSGISYIMACGRGSVLQLGSSLSPIDVFLRCVSSWNNGNSVRGATFEGYWQTSITETGGTISEVNLYKVTLDIYAEGIEIQTPYEYKAVATVSAEKIPSTIVPMS